MADIRFIAKHYIDQGWAVVPLVKGEKRASSSWQKKTYEPKDFGPTDGIAGKCGEPSGWRVDVDLDSREAVEAARDLLPRTGMVHGRPGKPDSHYWYGCDGIKTTQFTDVRAAGAGGTTSMLVEIRSTGGYTALPPSTHPSGDVLAWTVERDLMVMTPEDLYAAVRGVALVALLARHWPGAGVRHGAVGHLAGFLCQAGLEGAQVIRIISSAARIAGDPDLADRVKFATSTVAKHRAGENVTGGPKLTDDLGPEVVAKMRGWLKLADGDAIEEMNAKHFWCRLGKDDAIGREDATGGVVFQKPRSLYTEYANRQVIVGLDEKGKPTWKPLFQAWLESKQRRSYREVVFSPPPRPVEAVDYNLWTGFSVLPVPGECRLFLAHVKDIICSGNVAHYEYLLDLLALTCQEPGYQSEVAVVMRGKPGTGKGTFVRALGRIFERHFAHLDKTADLVGNFNAAISGKIIVFGDEAFWAGDKREVAALKRLITEPTLRITRKGIDSVQESNSIHLFMATNDDWSIPAQLGERRFLALKVSSARMGDQAYFQAVEKELLDGGLSAFLDMMLKRPFDRQALRTVPKTEELRAQQAQSLSPVLEWWQDCLYEGRIAQLGWPGAEWVPVASLFEAYSSWSSVRKTRLLSKVEFGRRMIEFFSAGESKSRKIKGEVIRCIDLRTLGDARQVFDAEAGAPSDWPTDPASTASNAIPF